MGLLFDLESFTYKGIVKPYSERHETVVESSCSLYKIFIKTPKLFSDLESNSEQIVDSKPLLRVP